MKQIEMNATPARVPWVGNLAKNISIRVRGDQTYSPKMRVEADPIRMPKRETMLMKRVKGRETHTKEATHPKVKGSAMSCGKTTLLGLDDREAKSVAFVIRVAIYR